MKICWDNLEGIKLTKAGNFRDIIRKKTWYYIDNCKECNEPFLQQYKNDKGIYCSNSCAKSNKNNSNWKGGVKKKNLPLYDTFAHQFNWCESVRRNKLNKNILEVKCAYCGKWYVPILQDVLNRIQVLKGNYKGELRLYCSESCKQECSIYGQYLYPKDFKLSTSREVQPELRQLVLKRDNYECQKCGSIESLHCHHLEGIRWEPLESADIDKCITLCKSCHIKVHKLPDCGYHDLQCAA